MDKKTARRRRARATRARIRKDEAIRLCIHRTPRHIYAQIIDATGGHVLTAASTLEPSLRSELVNGGNVTAATAIGKAIAERAKTAGVERVVFDRSGFKYHGRVKALAEAARAHGLIF